MPVSILDIDVKDDKFKRFSTLFEKYSKALEKMPKQWELAGAKAGDTAQTIRNATAAILAQNETLKHTEEAHKRIAGYSGQMAANYKTVTGTLDQFGRSVFWKAASLLSPMTWLSGAASLAKWGVFGGLGGLAAGGVSLWGLDRLASGAGQRRYQAGGLGLSTGRMEAADLYLSKFFNPSAVLPAISQARQEASGWTAFSAMGINNFQNRDPVELAEEMAIKARRDYRASGGNLNYMGAKHYTDFFSAGDLQRMGGMSEEEMHKSFSDMRRAGGRLGNTDAQLRAWQDLTIVLGEAHDHIRDTFVKILAPLAPDLQKLTGTVEDFITTFLTHDKLKDWIADVDAGLHSFATWLSDPKTKTKFEEFMVSFGHVADKLEGFAKWAYKYLPPWGGEDPSAGTLGANSTYSNGAPKTTPDGSELLPPTSGSAEDKQEYERLRKELDEKRAAWKAAHPDEAPYVDPAAPGGSGMSGGFGGVGPWLWNRFNRNFPLVSPGQWMAGGSVSNNVGNIENPQNMWGTAGKFRTFGTETEGVRAVQDLLYGYERNHHLDTIRGILYRYAPPDDNNDTEGYIRDVSHYTGLNAREHLNLHDPDVMSRLISAISRQEGRHYVPVDRVRVEIRNPAGADVATTSNAASVVR